MGSNEISPREAVSRKEDGKRPDREEGYRLLFAANPEPMWFLDRETHRFLEVNESAVARYGYARDEFLVMTAPDILLEEGGDSAIDREGPSETRAPSGGARKHRKKDGSVLWVEVVSHEVVFRARPAVFVTAHDVSERKRLEESLWLSQKLEAIGRLAGGIAHDFNNVLSVVLGYCNLLKSRLSDPELLDCVDEVSRAGERAATLTRQLLAFSRKQDLAPQLLDLNELIRNLEKMLRRLIGEDIELVTLLDPEIGAVRADAGQLEQVVTNLVVNARDALPRGGRVTIETAVASLDEEYARRHVSVTPGRYVLFAVTDNGIGMDTDTQKRIFEPFFSTKKSGEGTGLGLATVYGIVKQSGGNIWVYSEPGLGTTFKVYLHQVEEPATAPAVKPPAASAIGGLETILLVEDEESVRRLTGRLLESAGYSVLVASDAQEAFVRASKVDRVDLLLTDVVLPGMDGNTLFRSLRDLRPGLRVLFMSGYTANSIAQHGVLESGMLFLSKPFSSETLLRRIRQALES